MRYRLIRESTNETNLPDEIIELICSYISPVQLCLSGWDRVSKGFQDMLKQVYKSYHVLNTATGPDYKFFEQFCSPLAYEDEILMRKLEVVIQNVFPHLAMLSVHVGTFSIVLQYIAKFESMLLMPKLHFIHIILGDTCSGLIANRLFYDLTIARKLANGLKSVKLSVTLAPESRGLITCYSFRKFIRFVMEMAKEESIWCLCLKDKTKRAQGWFNPSELSSCAFISYVRTVLELNILLHKLELIDHFKLSPYMLIMRQKRRYLDLHDEYEDFRRNSR